MKIAGEIDLRPQVQLFPLDQASRALAALEQGSVHGAAVLRCGD
jgi:D-arabinose 1-dehydrogenase-like Zn-dependent alcohol dehydrogenase